MLKQVMLYIADSIEAERSVACKIKHGSNGIVAALQLMALSYGGC